MTRRGEHDRRRVADIAGYLLIGINGEAPSSTGRASIQLHLCRFVGQHGKGSRDRQGPAGGQALANLAKSVPVTWYFVGSHSGGF